MRSTSCRISPSQPTAPQVGGCSRSGTSRTYCILIIATPDNSNSTAAIYNSLATLNSNFLPFLASSSIATYRRSRPLSPLRPPALPLPSLKPTIPSPLRLSITTASPLSGVASPLHLPPRLSGSCPNLTRRLTCP